MRITLVGPAHPYKGGGARHTTELAERLGVTAPDSAPPASEALSTGASHAG